MSDEAILPMEPTMPPQTKTYSGRSLEVLLPRVQAELGADAIVLRCREGLRGGVLGFFRRRYVELEAMAGGAPSGPGTGNLASVEPAAEHGAAAAVAAADALASLPTFTGARNDRATAEGLQSEAMQLLVAQASPFADQLRAAAQLPSTSPAAALEDPRLYGPQPTRWAAAPEVAPGDGAPPAEDDDADVDAWPASWPLPAPGTAVVPDSEFTPLDVTPPAATPVPAAAAPPAAGAPLGQRLPATARTAAGQLVAAGLDSALADEIVAGAILHSLLPSTPRGVKKLVRGALAERLRTLDRGGPGAVTLAVCGPAGAGTSTLVAHLAAAYALAGHLSVVVITLGDEDDGAQLRHRLREHAVLVAAAADGATARAIADRHPGAMVLIDAGRLTADPTALACDLALLAPDELHLALPATLSAAVAAELDERLAPLGLTHVAVTRTDETRRPGAVLGHCLTRRRALSYLSVADTVVPARAATLAQLLLP